MSLYVHSSSAASFGYNLFSPASTAAERSIHSAQEAAVQSISLAGLDAIKLVKTAENAYHSSFPSTGGDQHQVSVPTDLSTLVKGG